jgi:hypothetical protein
MLINIKVKTGSSRNEIVKDNESNWRVFLSQQPQDGKANKKLIELIAKDVGVAKGRVVIDQGLKSKHKTVQIIG